MYLWCVCTYDMLYVPLISHESQLLSFPFPEFSLNANMMCSLSPSLFVLPTWSYLSLAPCSRNHPLPLHRAAVIILCHCPCLHISLHQINRSTSYLILPFILLVLTYCRRSGLQDRLTVAELRRLSEKLRRRRPGNDKKKDRAGACVVDYEKLCILLTGVPDSIPISRSEGVFSRLQDCVEDGVSDGRPFLSLCSLVDRQQTGNITKEVSCQLSTESQNHRITHTHTHRRRMSSTVLLSLHLATSCSSRLSYQRLPHLPIRLSYYTTRLSILIMNINTCLHLLSWSPLQPHCLCGCIWPSNYSYFNPSSMLIL